MGGGGGGRVLEEDEGPTGGRLLEDLNMWPCHRSGVTVLVRVSRHVIAQELPYLCASLRNSGAPGARGQE